MSDEYTANLELSKKQVKIDNKEVFNLRSPEKLEDKALLKNAKGLNLGSVDNPDTWAIVED